MSGWTVREVGNVKLEHYSTSSQIKLTIINKNFPVYFGKYEDTEETLWLDYGQFDDLKKAIELTK